MLLCSPSDRGIGQTEQGRGGATGNSGSQVNGEQGRGLVPFLFPRSLVCPAPSTQVNQHALELYQALTDRGKRETKALTFRERRLGITVGDGPDGTLVITNVRGNGMEAGA